MPLSSCVPRPSKVRSEPTTRSRTVRETQTSPGAAALAMLVAIGTARPRTLEEVGRAFNVTRERIRQIENHTLKKLESLPEAQKLRDAS